ncbi:MAG: hypothetical protein IPK58_25980 [Acidobacteria bacterium]|nr:hypothetical protein [Acidobacteriota bacterium]
MRARKCRASFAKDRQIRTCSVLGDAAVGAGWFLDIKTEGETAKVKSLIENRPFELTMKKNRQCLADVAIKDEVVA